tara:strand:+ start:1021 stop:1371 length:351 start_codon:yes stop_codon:yes gene_type:complete
MPRKPVNKHEKWLKSLSVKQLVAAAWNANANMYRGMDRDCLLEAVLAAPRRGLLHKRQVEACELSPHPAFLKGKFLNSPEYEAGMTSHEYYRRNSYMRWRLTDGSLSVGDGRHQWR